jgi:hypothetical protein
MLPLWCSLKVFIGCSCVVRYQEHTALGSFYDTHDAARRDIKREALGVPGIKSLGGPFGTATFGAPKPKGQESTAQGLPWVSRK